MPTDLENVIVGSGPSAYICALELIRNGQHCTIITPTLVRQSTFSKIENPVPSRKLFLKDRFTKSWVYRDPEARFKVQGRHTDLIETAAFGGLSNIWGAVCFPPLSINTFLPSLSSQEVETLLMDLKSILRINTNDSQFWPSNSSKAHQGEVFLQDPNPPIARGIRGGPWDLQDEWKMLDQSYITFREGFVSKVSRSKDGPLFLSLENSETIKEEIPCKRVFFACGPFGNARIILNSCPELDSIEIQDSSVKYKIFLDVTLQKRFENSMEPKQLFLHTPSDAANRMNYLQVYNLSWQLIQSFRFKRLHSILKSIAKILAPFISVGLIFKSSSESPHIILAKREFGGLESRVGAPSKSKLGGSRFTWKLMRSGLIPLPFRIKGKPGSGVHSGGFLGENFTRTEKALIHNQLHEMNGVHFVGTSNLSQIPAGPVTLLGLVHTLFTTRKVCAGA
jgi:hypothetical protein